jgi:putative FmdB family regulatory protein
MPTYEYQCKACQHTWEADQSIKDDALKDCPECKEPEAKRLVSGGTGFQLQGKGWSSDGYCKD